MENKKKNYEAFFVGIAVGLIISFLMPPIYAIISWIVIGIFGLLIYIGELNKNFKKQGDVKK